MAAPGRAPRFVAAERRYPTRRFMSNQRLREDAEQPGFRGKMPERNGDKRPRERSPPSRAYAAPLRELACIVFQGTSGRLGHSWHVVWRTILNKSLGDPHFRKPPLAFACSR